ncbi:MAG: serine hydrolase [Candidatus Binatia bacterium]
MLASAEVTMAASPCPPLGAILPPPVGPLASDEGIQKAARNLSFTLTNVIASDKATSVAVQMTSLSDREPLFQFYRTAQEVNLTGAHSVTPQTQFRFASVTKVFTVLAMLQHEERFDWRTPVPHYIPELMSNQSSSTNVDEYVVWEQATLDAMVSQLGGIPRDSESP